MFFEDVTYNNYINKIEDINYFRFRARLDRNKYFPSQRQKRKQELADAFVPSGNPLKDMTKEEIRELFG